ncbi:GNAT family N-acetyltransferase [Sandarakinorhabdus oryzae]|uniref:GNAT family N-acetyltransferase n=1 Tax=Sandarakinorhabdus oryzae TaxID=2675220 RepID=UPI0012E31DE8|nr:GNAT family N-acetyltransferase [Sandarakinorhabdus oryzae]
MATVSVRVVGKAREIPLADWNACAGRINPFAQAEFFRALEESGSASVRTGWQPVHLVADGDDGRPAGIMPAYLKTHSQGEYVFDHAWADAWERAGGSYYPKLQAAFPFTPATGPRLLLRDAAVAPALIQAAEQVTQSNGFSSAHATFITPEQQPLFRDAGWLIRTGEQFHWQNEGYRDFADFLAALSSSRRKMIRKERERALAGLEIVHLTGGAITEAHWDAFWVFYQDTGARKWGQPYLKRSFFSLVGEAMGDRVLLMLALRNGKPIAGALNFIGDECLYGRYWGCTEDVPFLHFELCYYQAIEWAIANGRARVEAGAQGQHKLARGYRPTPVISAHYIPNASFRDAVADYLARETRAVIEEIEYLDRHGPFRQAQE